MDERLHKARSICPKHMQNGPCGGVTPQSACEADHTLPCPYIAVLDHLPWRKPQIAPRRPPPRSHGKLEATLRAGEFALIAEAYTTDSADLRDLVARYRQFDSHITAVNVAEHALATPHASTIAAAALFEQAGIESIVNLTCRDRNQIALQGDVLGIAALGIKNVFCVTGDHPRLGDHPQAAAVFELDSLELIALTRQLCDQGRLLSGRTLERAPRLLVGGAANPCTQPLDLQAERVAAKVAVGADFIQTQAIFDLAHFGAFIDQLETWGALERAWLIAGVALVTTPEQGRWLQQAVPGARVPEQLITLLSLAPAAQRRATGLAYAVELIEQLRTMLGVSGVLLFPLGRDIDAIGETLELLA